MASHYVSQASFELTVSHDPPPSASWIAGTIDVHHHAQLLKGRFCQIKRNKRCCHKDTDTNKDPRDSEREGRNDPDHVYLPPRDIAREQGRSQPGSPVPPADIASEPGGCYINMVKILPGLQDWGYFHPGSWSVSSQCGYLPEEKQDVGWNMSCICCLQEGTLSSSHPSSLLLKGLYPQSLVPLVTREHSSYATSSALAPLSSQSVGHVLVFRMRLLFSLITNAHFGGNQRNKTNSSKQRVTLSLTNSYAQWHSC